jgi:hypothetical protein
VFVFGVCARVEGTSRIDRLDQWELGGEVSERVDRRSHNKQTTVLMSKRERGTERMKG